MSSSSSRRESDHKREQTDKFVPSKEALALIGLVASSLASLPQRDKGFVLANMKSSYFQHEFVDLKMKSKRGGTSSQARALKKSSVNEELAQTQSGRALASLKRDIKSYRKANKLPTSSKLPDHMFKTYQVALGNWKQAKQTLIEGRQRSGNETTIVETQEPTEVDSKKRKTSKTSSSKGARGQMQ